MFYLFISKASSYFILYGLFSKGDYPNWLKFFNQLLKKALEMRHTILIGS